MTSSSKPPFPATKGKRHTPEKVATTNLVPKSIIKTDGINVGDLQKTVTHCKASNKVLSLHWLSQFAARTRAAWTAFVRLLKAACRYVRYTHNVKQAVFDGRGDCQCDFRKFNCRCRELKQSIAKAVDALRSATGIPKLFRDTVTKQDVAMEVIARKLTFNYMIRMRQYA